MQWSSVLAIHFSLLSLNFYSWERLAGALNHKYGVSTQARSNKPHFTQQGVLSGIL